MSARRGPWLAGLVAAMLLAITPVAAQTAQPVASERGIIRLAEELAASRGDAAVKLSEDLHRQVLAVPLDRSEVALNSALTRPAVRKSSLASGAVYRQLGNVALLSGRSQEAEQRYLRASDLLRAAGDVALLAKTRVNLASAYSARGEYARAAEILRETMIASDREGLDNIRVMAANNLGVIYERIANFSRALEMYLLAAKEGERLGKPNLAFINAAMMHAELGQFDAARALIARMYKVWTPEREPLHYGMILASEGRIEHMAGNFSLAQRRSEQALRLFEQGGFTNEIAGAMCQDFVSSVALGRTEGMEAYGRKCQATMEEFGFEPVDYEVEEAMIALLVRLGRYKDAAELAVETSKKSQARSERLSRDQAAFAAVEMETALARRETRLAQERQELAELAAGRRQTLLLLAAGALVTVSIIAWLLFLAIRQRNAANAKLAASAAEIAEQKNALQKSVDQRELLLIELNHRVKNNLQVVSSILGLERRRAEAEGDGDEFSAFRDVQARVLSMASMHEGLQAKGDSNEVDLDAYLGRIAERLSGLYGHKCKVEVQLDAALTVDLAEASPLGLVVCELVSNACKHAYPGDLSGPIQLRFAHEDGAYRVTVADQGVGLPEGFAAEPSAAGTLGLTLAYDLVRQIGARLDARPNVPHGLVWVITLATRSRSTEGATDAENDITV
jgi:two-component sensor histidine kinase/tetratricopeptide (TPR) repeat protein